MKDGSADAAVAAVYDRRWKSTLALAERCYSKNPC